MPSSKRYFLFEIRKVGHLIEKLVDLQVTTFRTKYLTLLYVWAAKVGMFSDEKAEKVRSN